MLKFGNKEFRNLQQQVRKNKSDIQDIIEGDALLADFGIKVVGQVEAVSDLPDPATYAGDYGDAYLVGTQTPYSYYIFTRPFEGQEEPSWFNLGQFPVPGPQGPQGPKGDTGNAATMSVGTVSTYTLSPGQQARVTINSSGTSGKRRSPQTEKNCRQQNKRNQSGFSRSGRPIRGCNRSRYPKRI